MNQCADEIPRLILFERRGEKVGYREFDALRAGAILDPPSLDASLDSLLEKLEGTLVSAGLYQDEAHAMVESWKESWFEEGSRLIYIVPNSFVEKILPLSIEPQPATVHLGFLAPTELLTTQTQIAIRTAPATHDKTHLPKHCPLPPPLIARLA